MTARFEVFRGSGGDAWYWRLRAGNGEVVAQSEGYTTSTDAARGARDARKAARFARVVEVVR